MKKFLTSSLIFGLAISPVIADTLYNTDIADSCTVGILGSSEGTAENSFAAQYAPNKYTSAPGYYLLFDNGEISENQTCPTGSYCPGFTDVDFADSTMGLNTCPTIDSVAFTSASGSSAVTNCYEEDTAMSSALLNPFTTEHLNTSKNTDGYINGVKYASASTAARRYATSTTAAGDWTALDESDIKITDLACNTGYHYKAASGGTNPLANVDMSINGHDFGRKNDSRGQWGPNNSNADKYNLTEDQSWATKFSYGVVRGIASCNNVSGTNFWEGEISIKPGNTLSQNSIGQNCWCKITGFTPTGGVLQDLSMSSFWVFLESGYDGAADECAYECASSCSGDMAVGGVYFRHALFGAVNAPNIPPACVANEITVTWNQNNGQADITNTCTYDGDITLPTAPEKTGYTFKGWKLNKNN